MHHMLHYNLESRWVWTCNGAIRIAKIWQRRGIYRTSYKNFQRVTGSSGGYPISCGLCAMQHTYIHIFWFVQRLDFNVPRIVVARVSCIRVNNVNIYIYICVYKDLRNVPWPLCRKAASTGSGSRNDASVLSVILSVKSHILLMDLANSSCARSYHHFMDLVRVSPSLACHWANRPIINLGFQIT